MADNNNNASPPTPESLSPGTSSEVPFPETQHQRYNLYALYQSTIEPHLASRPVAWNPSRDRWEAQLRDLWLGVIEHGRAVHQNNRACGVCKSKNGTVRGDVEERVRELERDMLAADVGSGLSQDVVEGFEGRWARCDVEWWKPGGGGGRVD